MLTCQALGLRLASVRVHHLHVHQLTNDPVAHKTKDIVCKACRHESMAVGRVSRCQPWGFICMRMHAELCLTRATCQTFIDVMTSCMPVSS